MEETIASEKKLSTYFNIRKINVVIRILTFADLIVLSSLGLIAPIFAVFITNTIKGGNVEVVGIAAGLFLISKSIFQIPFGLLIDKIRGEKDDFLFMIIGYLLVSLVPLLYIFISTPTQLYAVEFIHGICSALTLPSWYAIFTRHIDKDYEGIEWAAYLTLVNLGGAITAFLGGFLAYRFGFQTLFVIVSIVSFIGSLFLLSIRKNMRVGRTLF